MAEITLEQNWFLADGSEPGPGEEKIWTIPFNFMTSSGVQKEVQIMVGIHIHREREREKERERERDK